MSERLKNGLFLTAVILLTLIPLAMVKAPVVGSGADTQAVELIQQIDPDYRPWFDSFLTPPSGEIESLFFALQAALGAGVIGYYAGYVRGKRAITSSPDVADRAH